MTLCASSAVLFNKFYSKFNEFRMAQKFTDLIIKCDNESFNVHRVVLASASEYFNTVLSGAFKEGDDQNVLVLKDTSAEIFKEVVSFIYAGDILISSSNVYGLLQASKIFKLPDIQDRCIRFVQMNKISVESTFDTFVFACATKIEHIVDFLSVDILEEIRTFSRSEKFLELSFDVLNVLVNKRKSLSSAKINDELLFGAIIRWVSHRRSSRLQSVEKLLREFRFENFNSEYMKFMFIKLLTNPDAPELTGIIEPVVGYDEVLEMSRTTAADLKNEEALNVFVQFVGQGAKTRVFSLRRLRDKKLSYSVSVVPNIRSNQGGIRSVALDDHLFCLHYPYGSSEKVVDPSQSFCMYNSVDLCSPLELKNPPVVFKDLSLCTFSFQNNIYACCKSKFQRETGVVTSYNAHSSSVIFNDDEIERGTYVYNCDLDSWFPIPAMGRKFHTCCATTHQETLYLFGSKDPYDQGTKHEIYIRAYDYRSGMWQDLKGGKFNHSIRTACCVFSKDRHRIFLHTGPGTLICYNTTAGKWEETIRDAFQPKTWLQYRRLISFSQEVWAIGNFTENGYDSALSVEILKGTYDGWWGEMTPKFKSRISPALTEHPQYINETVGSVLDAVIFRPL